MGNKNHRTDVQTMADSIDFDLFNVMHKITWLYMELDNDGKSNISGIVPQIENMRQIIRKYMHEDDRKATE